MEIINTKISQSDDEMDNIENMINPPIKKQKTKEDSTDCDTKKKIDCKKMTKE